MITAIGFGKLHRSCEDAMAARRALGEGATQADWWRVCPRGDWMIWQLARVGLHKNNPALQRAIERIVERAIRRALAAIGGVSAPWADRWRAWALAWLDGTDRSVGAAKAAAEAAAWEAWAAEAAAWEAWAAEAAAEIPEWPI